MNNPDYSPALNGEILAAVLRQRRHVDAAVDAAVDAITHSAVEIGLS